MDEAAILGRDDESDFFKQVLCHYAAPAYMRRARRVQEALDDLLARCRQQRNDWLAMVRMRLGMLRGLAGEWEALRPFVAGDDQLALLQQLDDELQPRLRMPIEATSSSRALRRALTELIEAINRFNERWQRYLDQLDLSAVNEVRDGYNRHYLLEKECALRSPRVARQGFRQLPPVTAAEVAALCPPLTIPRMR